MAGGTILFRIVQAGFVKKSSFADGVIGWCIPAGFWRSAGGHERRSDENENAYR